MSESTRDFLQRWRRALWSAALGASAYLASLALRAAPGFTERVYARGIGPVLIEPLSRLSGLLPFALGEWLTALYVGALMVMGARGVSGVLSGRQRLVTALGEGMRRALVHVGVLAAGFYLLWGFNYARAPLAQRLAWPAWQGAEVDEVEALAIEALEAANAAYRTLHGSDDAGVPTPFPEPDERLRSALQKGWVVAADRLDLGPQFDRVYGRPKRPLSSGVLARFGIAGMFFPFTAEANLIRGLPAVSAAHSMAHEQAHQRGVANEAEASFLGFVAGSASLDPLLRYSCAVFAARQLLGVLAQADRERFDMVTARWLPGVRRDLGDAAAFWARYRGVGTRIGSAVNDRYLRANRVPGGIRSYGMSVILLIDYARQSGGGLFGPGSAHSADGVPGQAR
ncbi:MAG: DUF3810 domain-containing protein [Gemmatimonadota bacterium]